uniref:RCC1-like domain-containing protein n=1 Tax=Palpitomonas bilix TaxID=652834 RepID=A0A7S3G3L6_9EUKA|mmetsp:Transcript_1620/g.3311  ORF Transcript_1620/g.3311 Transcript_1620/m.3311 type:complete len:565 (+) Transcript_1620:56-1750(+)
MGNAVALQESPKGTVALYGDGTHGQLGFGLKKSLKGPDVPPEGSRIWLENGGAIDVKVGNSFTLVHLATGRVDIIGNLTPTIFTAVEVPRPVAIGKAVRAKEIAAGRDFAAIIDEKGNLFTFGCGNKGKLGHGHEQHLEDPTLVKFFQMEAVEVVSVGCGGDHTAAITSDGRCFTWGLSTDGRLGHGALAHSKKRGILQKIPLEVEKVKGAVRVGCGDAHTIAVLQNGSLMGWGSNADSQLGLRDRTPSMYPTLIPDLEDIKIIEVACGQHITMAIADDGKVFAWGQANTTAERGARGAPFPFQPARKGVRISAFACSNTVGVVTEDGMVVVAEKSVTKNGEGALKAMKGVKSLAISASSTHTAFVLSGGENPPSLAARSLAGPAVQPQKVGGASAAHMATRQELMAGSSGVASSSTFAPASTPASGGGSEKKARSSSVDVQPVAATSASPAVEGAADKKVDVVEEKEEKAKAEEEEEEDEEGLPAVPPPPPAASKNAESEEEESEDKEEVKKESREDEVEEGKKEEVEGAEGEKEVESDKKEEEKKVAPPPPAAEEDDDDDLL